MNLPELKTLCALCGTSGREHAVREYILNELKKCSLPENAVTVDRLGNILVHKKGASAAKRKILFAAHMDEVAMMITDICEDGMLRFDTVGGILPAAIIGRQVQVGKDRITGVIGCKPIHLLSKDEKSRPADLHSLYCDIGTGFKAESMQYVRQGDLIYFESNPQTFGADSFVSKAIDDRFGCLLMLEMIRSTLPYDTDFAFTVQEEVGLRGAGVAAAQTDPDIAVILESTTAADLPDVQGSERTCSLGGGAVISFMDGRTVYDKALYDLAAALCDQKGIRWQTKTKIAGGNDAGAIQSAGRGARVLAVSVPCRYLHAPCTVIRLADAEACEQLVRALIPALQEAAL